MSYAVYIEPDVHAGRGRLPGHIRAQVRRLLDALATNPRPPASQALDTADLTLPPGVEMRRVRLDQWRVVYAVHDRAQWVWVLGIFRRPPYDYADLADLAARLQP